MLMRTLKMTFWVVYDHLGKLLLANFICACAAVVPMTYAFGAFVSGDTRRIFWITLPLTGVITIVIVPVVQAGLLWMVKELIEKHDGSLKTFFVGVKKFGLRAAGIGFAFVFVSICLLSSVWFYGTKISFLTPVLGYALSAAAVWAQIFLLLMVMLALPALVNKNTGVFGAFKIAAVLLLDNPLFVAGVAVHILIVLAFSIAPPVFLFLSFVFLAALQGSAYEILARKYAAIQAHIAAGGKFDKSLIIDFGDDDDEYLCRGFRDLLFPWKE